ncbi:LINE-1 type transposase domain-containing protein 1 [Labeo rohita]|uniref:LINE-1 type transposase domain-containing protein 1 n=1 Tax=Labeo rohita TaxID=84645 RepID=A0ABQ8LB43_LABRO|nr:LINE-1 type transposase domain-containing protein 1 [Labeo rohita]
MAAEILTEMRAMRQEVAAYMLTKQRQLGEKCEDLESRSRRSNIRIYGVKEGAEGEMTMTEFTDNLLKSLLELPADRDLGIERAHRSLITAPTDPKASPRSIVVKFLHFPTKQQILFKAWSKKGLKYQGNIISLDNDYSLDIQRRRKEYRDIKRQLKERHIKFRSPYPAMLKVSLESGEKTFHSAWEAADGLKHLGITVSLSESELIEKELSQLGWLTQGQARGRHPSRAVLSDMRALTT